MKLKRPTLRQLLGDRVLSWLRKTLQSDDEILVKGNLDVVMRYSDLYPNTKLRGEVHRYYELGSNLVTIQGRRMLSSLTLGTQGVPGIGHAQSDGWVIRGFSVGTSDQDVEDEDDDLVAPILRSDTNHQYYEIDSSDWPASPSTEVTYIKTLGALEPTSGTLLLREAGLWTAAPVPTPPATAPVVTTPAGPVGGPYLVARKTFGVITKTSDFSIEARWTWKF